MKNLERFWKPLEREAGKSQATKCAFVPKTFKLPSEYHLWKNFARIPGIAFIMKPVSMWSPKEIETKMDG